MAILGKASGRLTQKRKHINAKFKPLCNKEANRDHSKDHNKVCSKVCQECSKQYKKAHSKESKTVCSKAEAGGYPEAPSQIQAMLQGGMSPQQLLSNFGQGTRFTWGGGAQGTSITPGGGGGAQYPMAPSDTEFVWYRYKIYLDWVANQGHN